MSAINTNITKQPLKVIEVPLNKFSEEVIPHHQNIYEQHKTLVLKLISENNASSARQQVRNKKHLIKQLKDLMYEVDTLRAQVEDAYLDKFDTKTVSFRKIIISLISGYTDLEKRTLALDDNQNQNNESHTFEAAPQIHIQCSLDEVKLKQREELLNDVENVERDAEDLNFIFSQLNQMVDEQRENVNKLEEISEGTQENIHSGLKHLIKAQTLKTAAYPVTGAVLGSMIGGPIGMMAGVKIGSLAALGCAIAGYTGGRIFKKNHEIENMLPEPHETSGNKTVDDTQEKKDI